MKPTKVLTLILAALFFARPSAHGQVIVYDPVNAWIAITNHLEEILKLVTMIEELETTKDWLGNAGKVLDLAGLDKVFADLQSEGVGRSRVDLASSATSVDGTAYEGDGLYTPVGETFVSRDGQTISRPDVFKPEAAIFSAVRDHDGVYEDVMSRRETLRLGIHQTLSQLQAATTHAEVLKTMGVLVSQHAELEATDRELTFATQKAVLLDLQNRADKERQEKARQQEQAHEFSEALHLFSDVLQPPVFVPQVRPPSSGGSSTLLRSPVPSLP